jgi:hypothetical protein
VELPKSNNDNAKEAGKEKRGWRKRGRGRGGEATQPNKKKMGRGMKDKRKQGEATKR